MTKISLEGFSDGVDKMAVNIYIGNEEKPCQVEYNNIGKEDFTKEVIGNPFLCKEVKINEGSVLKVGNIVGTKYQYQIDFLLNAFVQSSWIYFQSAIIQDAF